jgi:hypothetical protein
MWRVRGRGLEEQRRTEKTEIDREQRNHIHTISWG